MILVETNTVNIKKKMTEIRRTRSNTIIQNYYSNCENDPIIWSVYGDRTVVFWDDDNGVKRVYFYSDNEAELELLLSHIPEEVTLEFITKGPVLYDNLFRKAGFEPLFQMKRFSSGLLSAEEQMQLVEFNKTLYEALYDSQLAEKAEEKDCDELYKKLYEVFDPRESHLCNKETLSQYIENGWVAVSHLDGVLVGFQIFTVNAGQFYGYQIWNGGGPEILFNLTNKTSELFAEYIKDKEIKHTRPSYAWVNVNNRKSIRNVTASGMRFDGLMDYGYVKRMENKEK